MAIHPSIKRHQDPLKASHRGPTSHSPSTNVAASKIVNRLKVKKSKKKKHQKKNKKNHQPQHPVISPPTSVDITKPSNPTATPTMRRVSSRQRFTIEDDFSAAAVVSDTEEDDESYEEVGLSLEQQLLTRKRVRIQRSVSLESLAKLSTSPSLQDSLNDDLQLYVASFLPEQDVRTMIALNSSYHQLLSSEDANQVWRELCTERWGTEYPTGTIATKEHYSQLLQQASPCHPSQIDPKSFLPPLVHRLRGVRDRLPPPNFSLYQDHPNRAQYTGSVGTGDRCFKGNAALARPRRDHNKKRSTAPATKLSNPFMDFLCRGAAGVVGGHKPSDAKPFVAPFVNQSSQTILMPRLVSYFEVSILQKPSVEESPSSVRERLLADDDNTQQQRPTYDCVAVGLSTEAFSTHGRMPGWDGNSWGYHGDDGGLFHGCGDMLRRFGSSFGEGDVVGCGVDYTVDGIFYTLNGQFLGYGWTHISNLTQMDLHPTVGVDTNCPIETNFGTKPFDFDLEAFANERAEFSKKQGHEQLQTDTKYKSSFRRR